MNPLTVNFDNFNDTVSEYETIVVDMWASWCLPCRRFAPIFAQTAQSTPDVTFASFQVDASEENEAMFAALGYTTVPTLMAFRNGTLVVATSGALGKADLATVLKQVREDAPAAA